MKCLLLVAHGSRRPESNLEIAQLTDRLRGQVESQFHSTEHAFLELAKPSIDDAIDQFAGKGASEVVVLPYFLSAGRHIHEDVPNIIAAKQQQYTHLKIHITPYIGESSDMITLLTDLSRQH